MAETDTKTAGIKTNVKTSGKKPKGKQKKNRALILGAAGLGGILLLSHKGSSGADGQGANQLATGELDAYQQGIQDAGTLAGLNTGSVGVGADGSGGGGGVGDTTGAGAGSGGAGDTVASPLNINVATTPARRRRRTKKPKGHGKSHKKHKGAGEKSSVQHHKTKRAPHPAEPHRTRPKPANKRGRHPTTRRRHRRGYRRGSDVVVESPQGEGYGVQVFGRTFPGATGHRLGPPRSIPGAGLVRDVTVIYGGHSETHTHHMDKGWWRDHTRGRNPLQNRPVPQLVHTNEIG